MRDAPQRYAWPTANDIGEAFREGRYYGPGGINQDRLRLLFSAIDARLQQQALKSEPVTVSYDALQVEHVIPREWREYWPVLEAEPNARLLAEQERERHVNRIGNLTLITGNLNVSLSNDPWTAKRAALAEHSKLRLNALLVDEEAWDEARINARGEWLARELEHIWPGPDAELWNG